MFGLMKDLASYTGTLSCYTFGEYLHLSLKNDGEEAREQLQHYLAAKGHTGIVMDNVTPTIEDCFIKLLKN